MDQNDTPAPFPVVSGYAIERHLGSGAGSRVYLLRRQRDGVLLALKLLDAGVPGSLEAEASLGLEHEFLLAHHGLVETDRGPGLLLDYCPGGSAARLLAVRGPLSAGEAVTVCAPVASALAYLHEEGVVHGDVAPGNILFTAEGMPQLADLGLRAVLGREAAGGGTPGFMAPETRAAGSGLLEPARDVYALAAVLWYLLTGRTAGTTRQRPPLSTLLPGIPEELVELIEAALAEDPRLRPTAADMAARIFVGTTAKPIELEDVVEPEAVGLMATVLKQDPPRSWRPHRPHLRHRPRRTGRSNRGAAKPLIPGVLLGVLALLIVGGTGIWIWSVQQDRRTVTVELSAPVRPAESASAPRTRAPAPPPSETETGQPEAPTTALVRLVGLRDAALSAGSASRLAVVHAAGSPSLAHDQRTVAALTERGMRFVDLKTVITQVREAESPGSGSVLLNAHSFQESYRVEDERGRLRAEARDQGADVRFELRLLEEGWKIWSVSAAQ